jgi:hypothetical protein
MLQFDWKEVEGTAITAVMAKRARRASDRSLECDEIALVLGAKAVVLRVHPDTREVIVTHEDFGTNGAGWQRLDQLDEIVSRPLGWCWIGRNYRGYLDTFSLGLDGMTPAYSFTGAAASLQCARVIPIPA